MKQAIFLEKQLFKVVLTYLFKRFKALRNLCIPFIMEPFIINEDNLLHSNLFWFVFYNPNNFEVFTESTSECLKAEYLQVLIKRNFMGKLITFS